MSNGFARVIEMAYHFTLNDDIDVHIERFSRMMCAFVFWYRLTNENNHCTLFIWPQHSLFYPHLRYIFLYECYSNRDLRPSTQHTFQHPYNELRDLFNIAPFLDCDTLFEDKDAVKIMKNIRKKWSLTNALEAENDSFYFAMCEFCKNHLNFDMISLRDVWFIEDHEWDYIRKDFIKKCL